ncbi:MAG TPA: DUF1501 domain-containing protein [Kofleriaceae bacterium]|nr:DUF1501 domain-containing protein [Kofleriaceae bacterium]
MKRRTFLTIAGGAGGAVLMGPWIRRSRAATFGAFPGGTESVQLPEGQRAKKILEVFLYGGLSAWETLYFVRDYGKPTDPMFPNTQYYAFASSNAQAASACGGSEAERPFATDANGAMVEVGPFASRLAQRSDVVDRMRIIVQRHTLEPHEAAVPMALTGRPVGQPNAAGLGAHVQRARIDSGLTPDRASPHAYAFVSGGVSSDNVAAAAAAGTHPGSARPLLVKTTNAAGFTNLLARSTVGANRASHDALVKAYIDQYQARLTWPDQGRVRSARTDDLVVAQQTTTKTDAIRAVFTDDLLATKTNTACGTSDQSVPHMGLSAAAALLTHPSEPASYVCVSDIGLIEASGGGGYDTHTRNATDTARNFDNMLHALLGIIRAPGDTDPRKISLDDTLIILNTEFGRTPGRQDTSGRNHHPYGYATAFIGGPITSAHKGVSGAIARDGTASAFATPSENRMAALLALGIWPFAAEGFNVSDAPNATTELAAAQSAMGKFLGRVS